MLGAAGAGAESAEDGAAAGVGSDATGLGEGAAAGVWDGLQAGRRAATVTAERVRTREVVLFIFGRVGFFAWVGKQYQWNFVFSDLHPQTAR